MGACLSCLGFHGDGDEAERQRLLNEDDPQANGHQGHHYGSWSQAPPHGFPPQNLMSAEEIARERKALNSITRWASDQIVEIFPHRTNLNIPGVGLSHAPNQVDDSPDSLDGVHGQHNNGNSSGNVNGTRTGAGALHAHQEILLSMIPGDKSKRSIRIYPASRPTSSSSHNLSQVHGSDSGDGRVEAVRDGIENARERDGDDQRQDPVRNGKARETESNGADDAHPYSNGHHHDRQSVLVTLNIDPH